MLENLTSGSFAAHKNTAFRMSLPGGGTLRLDLVDVEERENSPKLEQFSITFRGTATPVCPQQIYRLEHEKLGVMELFLVPLGPDGAGMLYQSCFNRLRKSGGAAPP